MTIPNINPFQEVDWRYRRVQTLVAQNQRPARHCDDRWTWAAWRFFHALADCSDERQRDRVRQRQPDLAAAVDLHQSADDFRRWEVESRLLAGESFADVAARTGLTPEAVEAYVRVFYDVADSLHATVWVLHEVLQYIPSRTLTEDDAELFCKLYAYFAGPFVLDALLGFYRDPEPVPADVTQVAAHRLHRTALHTRIRAALVARCAPFGDPRVDELTHMAERLEALVGNGSNVAPQDPVNPPRRAGEEDHSALTPDTVLPLRRAG